MRHGGKPGLSPALFQLATRAYRLWRREGTSRFVRLVRARLRPAPLGGTGRRRASPPDELVVELDTGIPGTLPVGAGTALCVGGSCFHAASRVRALEVVVDGMALPVKVHRLPRRDRWSGRDPDRDPRGRSFASGFWAIASLPAVEAPRRVAVQVRARLGDGRVLARTVAEPRLVPGLADPAAGGMEGIPLVLPRAADESAPTRGDTPHVAICMATYQPPLDLFAAQVESIRTQTHRRWSCIVRDDGSEPATWIEMQRIVGSDPRFGLYRGTARLGFYRNFERCLTLVPESVDFVALSDQDDRWHPDKLATLLAAWGEGTSLVYSDMSIMDRDGRRLAGTYWTERPKRHDRLASLLITNTVTGAASLFPRHLLRMLLPFPPELGRPFHDHWLACVALAAGPIRYVPRPLYDYVQHGSQVLGHQALGPGAGDKTLGALGREVAREGVGSRLGRMLGGWGGIYRGELLRIQLMARILELRFGPALGSAHRRDLYRIATMDEGVRGPLWLGARALCGLGGVTETVGGERVLLRGILWKQAMRLRGSVRPFAFRQAARRLLDTVSDNAPTAGLQRIRVIEEKTAPLRLTIAPEAPPRVNLLVPTLDLAYFFGGYIAKLNLALRLVRAGLRVRVVTVDHCLPLSDGQRRQLIAYEGLEGFFEAVEVAHAYDRARPCEVNPDDAFVASTWWTAHVAYQAAVELGRRGFLYLIQEYEPFTFPMGTFAALARQSYDFAHYAVFSSESLREYFRREGIGVFAAGPEAGDRGSIAFQNAITAVGPVRRTDIADRAPRRLLFYARPEAHAARNMFELGILALRLAVARGAFPGPWEFAGIGSVDGGGEIALGHGHALRLGPRQSQGAYGETLRRHDVGLALMYTPHPSLVPIEMASAGMLVVTTSFANKTATVLRAISPNFVVAEPTIEGVARGLAEAAAAVTDYDRRVAGADVKWSRSWDQTFDTSVVARIQEFLRAGGAERDGS